LRLDINLLRLSKRSRRAIPVAALRHSSLLVMGSIGLPDFVRYVALIVVATTAALVGLV
jgi:hypothetical protein